MELKTYQYGSSPEHIVRLTENQARAVNEGLFFPNGDEDKHDGYTSLHGTFRLPDGVTIQDYNSAADILNDYIGQTGPIPCSEEYLLDHSILTEI